jgi:hypothetical protein
VADFLLRSMHALRETLILHKTTGQTAFITKPCRKHDVHFSRPKKRISRMCDERATLQVPPRLEERKNNKVIKSTRGKQ